MPFAVLRTPKTFTVALVVLFLATTITILTTHVSAENNSSEGVDVGPQPMTPGMVFSVTKVADTNDGVCDADCSFREAIVAANANLGLDTINFHIGSGLKTIFPTSGLPNITDPVVIDATTQTGFSGNPLIEIDGTNAGDVGGLIVQAGNSTIRGLILNGFRFGAIQIFVKGNNLVAGNYIGTNAAGTATHGGTQNNGIGIQVSTANNIIGGTTAADRNVISGNKNQNVGSGVWVQGAAATGNKIIGNYIGTDVTGVSQIPHNNSAVFLLSGASGNFVGGLTLERNVISGGGNNAIELEDSSNNKIQRNLIGVGVTGLELGTGYGIQIDGTSQGNVIGGSNTGEGNLIAYANQKAIWINSTNAIKNSILGNFLYNNKFGIDLGANGITPNDLNDVDTGANNLQNFPLITTATPNGASVTIAGTLNSVANTQYRIELFVSPTCNASGNGEGKGFLGSTTASLAGNDGTFNATFPVDVLNKYITATATDPNGNTSEFSPCVLAGNPNVGRLEFANSIFSAAEGTSASIIVNRTGGSVGAVSVQYSTAPGTATPGADYDPASGTLNWADGDSSAKTFSIPLKTDFLSESQESVKLTLANSVGAPLGNPTAAILQIADVRPVMTISPVSKAEGNSGTTDFVFNVNLDAPTDKNVTVKFETSAGSATVGNDFQPTNGMLTYIPGELSKQIIVQVNGDSDSEPNETFSIVLSNPVNCALPASVATGTILNDDGAGPATFNFSPSQYGVNESFFRLSVTVERIGDTTGTSSVGYRTIDGTATQKGDYEYSAGRLTFGPGEVERTFDVLFNNDSLVEGNETFSITLESPTNAVLGAQKTASISLIDDNQEPPANSIDDAAAFVTMQYHDFLNREPDSSGLNFWINQITACGSDQQCVEAKRTNVSAAFFLSIEFQETGYLVYRTHKVAFGSVAGGPTPVRYTDFLADTQQIGHDVVVNEDGWEQTLEGNKQAFMLDFVQRSQFVSQYPTSMTPAVFVDALFSHAGIVPTAVERSNAIAQFSNPADTNDLPARAKALRLIAENKTLGQQEFNKAFVLMQYFGYLRRNPNDTPDANFDGYSFWLNKLNAFNGNYVSAELVKAFIQSLEYRQRFGM